MEETLPPYCQLEIELQVVFKTAIEMQWGWLLATSWARMGV